MSGNPGADTQFKAGRSGNPGGRPRGIAAKAREHGASALAVLVAALDDGDSRVRISAAKEILDRGYGKPVAMTADVTRQLDDLNDAELDNAIDAIKAVGNC